jgi:hypothetical protein
MEVSGALHHQHPVGEKPVNTGAASVPLNWQHVKKL